MKERPKFKTFVAAGGHAMPVNQSRPCREEMLPAKVLRQIIKEDRQKSEANKRAADEKAKKRYKKANELFREHQDRCTKK